MSSTTRLAGTTSAQAGSDWIAEALRALITCDPEGLDAHLSQVAVNEEIVSTRGRFHCYCLALDGNKLPRLKDLARKAARKVVDYALPHKEKRKAREQYKNTGSLEAFSELEQKARLLFTSMPQTGEPGEVLLYLLAETYLGLPQLFCKMPLKTSSNVHVHGSDGVHAAVDAATGELALYWGEAKMYGNVASAVSAALDSLAPFLTSAGGSDSAQERDLQLIRDNLDLNDSALEDAILKYLDPNDPCFCKLQYRGLSLIAFDSGVYPTAPNVTSDDAVREAIKKSVDAWKARVGGRITASQLSGFHLDMLMLPLPAVEEFRKAFLAELGQP